MMAEPPSRTAVRGELETEKIMSKLPKLVRLGDAKRLTKGQGVGSTELNEKPIQPMSL